MKQMRVLTGLKTFFVYSVVLLFCTVSSLHFSYGQNIVRADLSKFNADSEYSLFHLLDEVTKTIQSDSEKSIESIIYLINTIADHYYLQPKMAGVQQALYHVELYYDNNLQAKLFDLRILPNSDRNQIYFAFICHPIVKKNPLLRTMMMSYLLHLFNAASLSAYDPQSNRSIMLNYEISFKVAKLNYLNMRPVHFAELFINAQEGSPFAQLQLLRIEKEVLENVIENVKNGFISQAMLEGSPDLIIKEFSRYFQLPMRSDVYDALNEYSLSLERQTNEVFVLAKKEYKKKHEIHEAKKHIRFDLEEKNNLSELVKSGNRKQVYQILKEVIPWSLLEPTETILWQQYLDSILHPDWQNSVLLYRGIDAKEKMQFDRVDKNQIDHFAMFAKRLTAGSGSHIYKLFGLPGTFEKTGVLGNIKEFRPYEIPHTNFAMLMNHAASPQGSMYISATFSPQVALNFSEKGQLYIENMEQLADQVKEFQLSNKSGGMASLLIDPRRFIVNSFSTYTGEVEVLIPLIIFPDEILHLQKAMDFTIYRLLDPSLEPSIANRQYIENRKIQLDDFLKTSIMKYEQKTGNKYPVYATTTELLKDNTVDPYDERFKLFRFGVRQLNQLYVQTQKNRVMLCDRIFYR